MRKVIAAINMTLDGFCDHTAGIPDEQLHRHYTDLLRDAGVILYGRKTFQLMEYWKPFIRNPSGVSAMDDFAVVMDQTPKLVFSHTLKELNWHSATLSEREPEEEIKILRSQPGKDIFVGSPGLISSLTFLDLIDEYQLCIHPVLIGEGLPLFKHVKSKTILNLVKTKTFGSGAVVFYYTTNKTENNADNKIGD
jgi:dihydrofolate reductase